MISWTPPFPPNSCPPSQCKSKFISFGRGSHRKFNELHDFFLYYAIRWAFPPRKVLRLAEHAFGRTYPRAVVLQWLRTFYRRFFAQQFKRSCLPDGPKVGSVSLSPRGDWRMPSDAVAALWLEELEGLE